MGKEIRQGMGNSETGNKEGMTMGITIATKDRRFTLKLDDDKSEEMFNNIVTKILTGGVLPQAP